MQVIPGYLLHKELEVLIDFDNSAQLLAGNILTTSPVSVPINPGGTNGSLASDELAEIVAIEYWPPFDALFNEQFLSGIWYIPDGGDASQSHFYMSGRADLNIFPSRYQVLGQPRFTFIGGGIMAAAAILQAGPLPDESQGSMMNRAMRELAVPRYKQSMVFAFQAGPNIIAATSPFHLRAWGYRYTKQQVDSFFGGLAFGGQIEVSRPWNSQKFTFNVPFVQVSSDNWTNLPGGDDQQSTSVQPFLRWGIQSQATAANQEYSLTFTGAVGSQVNPNDQYQNLDFDLTKKSDVLFIDGFCVRALNVSADTNQTDLVQAGVNLAYQYLRVPNDQPHSYHPNNALPAGQYADNPQLAGETYPAFGIKASPTYDQIRPLALRSQVIAQARGYVAIKDNGTSIGANQVGAIISGLYYRNVANLVQQ